MATLGQNLGGPDITYLVKIGVSLISDMGMDARVLKSWILVGTISASNGLSGSL